MFFFIISYEFTNTTAISIITNSRLKLVRKESKCLSHGLVLVQANFCFCIDAFDTLSLTCRCLDYSYIASVDG